MLVGAEDCFQAFEQICRLNLKKVQEREVIRVLLQCCLTEKTYNKYYGLVAEKMVQHAPQSYKYTLKYTLWDHLKTIEKLKVRQVVNLAKFYGGLVANNSIPLHFLKVVDFSSEHSKPLLLFLHLLLDTVFEESETLKEVFERGLPKVSNKRALNYDSDSDDDFMQSKKEARSKAEKPEGEDNSEQLKEFVKGFATFILTKFYNRVKDNEALQGKIKEAFEVIGDRRNTK